MDRSQLFPLLPRQAAEHPLKRWEWTIYQVPPFLWQEVAPSTVVFSPTPLNSFWARGLERAKGCELQDPGPTHSRLLGEKMGTAFPESILTLKVHGL